MCLPHTYFCISSFHTLYAVQLMHISLRLLCTTLTSTDPMALELPTATMKNHLDKSGTPACRSICKAEPIQSLATDLFTGRLTSSLAQATTTWINLLATLCSPSPLSSLISRHVQSASIMKAPSFYSLRLTMIPSMISKMPLGFQPPITLPRYMTSTSPFSTNKTSLQPMRKT